MDTKSGIRNSGPETRNHSAHQPFILFPGNLTPIPANRAVVPVHHFYGKNRDKKHACIYRLFTDPPSGSIAAPGTIFGMICLGFFYFTVVNTKYEYHNTQR